MIPVQLPLRMTMPDVQVVEVYSQNSTYIFTQAVAAADWYIQHDLNKYPSVTVVDSANTLVMGGVEYVSPNVVILHFSAPFSGKAYLN